MKTNLAYSLGFLFAFFFLPHFIWSQSNNYHSFGSVQYNEVYGNPNRINMDYEPLFNDVPPSGWVQIQQAPDSQWTGFFPLPIPFKWNEGMVNQFKIHSRGFVSFGHGTQIPILRNDTLPHPSIPDSSICVWGLKPNPLSRLFIKTFGQAPKRQFWIQFNHWSGNTTMGNYLTNGLEYETWAVVLEETSNSIYMVSQNSDEVDGTYNLHTLGLQFNQTDAVMTKDKKKIYNFKGNKSAGSGTYWGFRPGPPPLKKIEISSIETPALTNSKTFSAVLRTNLSGSQPFDSIEVWWQLDSRPAKSFRRIVEYDGQFPTFYFINLFSSSLSNPDSLDIGYHTVKACVRVVGSNQSFTDTLKKTIYKTTKKGIKKIHLLTSTSKYCPNCPAVNNLWNTYYSIGSPHVIHTKFSTEFGPDPFVIQKRTAFGSAFGLGTGVPKGVSEVGPVPDFVSPYMPSASDFSKAANRGAYATINATVKIDTNTFGYQVNATLKSRFPTIEGSQFRLLCYFVQKSITTVGFQVPLIENYSVRDILGNGMGVNLPPLEADVPKTVSFTSKLPYQNNEFGLDSIGKWSGMVCVLQIIDYNQNGASPFEKSFEPFQSAQVNPVFLNGITGLDDEVKPTELSIWPNPGNGEFTLHTSSSFGNTALIYNLVGELISSLPLAGNFNKISLTRQPAGLYVVRVGKKTIKFEKH